MRNFLNAKVSKEIIIKSPADIVMTAEIILEYIISWKTCNNNISI